jgi:hypothetical protein
VKLGRSALGDLVSGSQSVEALVKAGALSGEGSRVLHQIFNALDLIGTPINLVIR